MLNFTEAPSAHADSAASTPRAALDRAVGAVAEQRTNFARMSPADKAILLKGTLPLLARVSRAWVAAACEAKGLRPDRPSAGEEWFGGPMITARNVRLLV